MQRDGEELQSLDLVLRTSDGDVQFKNAGEANDFGCSLSKVASVHLNEFVGTDHVTIYLARTNRKFVLTAFKPKHDVAERVTVVEMPCSYFPASARAKA